MSLHWNWSFAETDNFFKENVYVYIEIAINRQFLNLTGHISVFLNLLTIIIYNVSCIKRNRQILSKHQMENTICK